MKETERVDLAIIGGGPAGLAAAIAAARAGAHPVVLEARERMAETIRPTGDGRCNISNARVNARDYHNGDFVRRAFVRCRPPQVRAFLESCGIMLREEGEGRLYPLANKSTAVIEALLAAARRAGVVARYGHAVLFVRRNGDFWTLSFDDASTLRADTVIVATGGALAEPFLPSSVDTVPREPVLAPLACDERPIRGLDKIRVKCAISCGDTREEGEVTFRTYGLSGICAFNMSRFAKPGDMLTIDFAPTVPVAESAVFLRERLATLGATTWGEYTYGMMLPQVSHAVLRAAGLHENARPQRSDLTAFEQMWRTFPLQVRGIGDAKLAQVQRGGVDVSCIDPREMAVAGAPGLYVAGEAVDVDGPCGGYNLHWAWTSGLLAGEAAVAGSKR